MNKTCSKKMKILDYTPIFQVEICSLIFKIVKKAF